MRSTTTTAIAAALRHRLLAAPLYPRHRAQPTASSMGSNTAASPTRLLLAFDFDHTVVDGNTDTHIIKASSCGTLPADLKASLQPGRWTEYMQRVLAHLHAEGVSVRDMQQAMQQLPYTAGMEALLQQLQTGSIAGQPCSCVILSDSNSEFIDWVLSSRGHRDIFSHVYTNPATQSPEGALQVSPHHSHECAACPVNMCKRAVLQAHLQRTKDASSQLRVVYVGDGGNDLCPAQSLGADDLVFVRTGYGLHKLLQDPSVAATVRARLHFWESGDEIVQALLSAL